jgi:hypothetical protein
MWAARDLVAMGRPFVLLACLCFAAPLAAQSRLSLEGHVAPVMPIGRVVDTQVVLSEQIDGSTTSGLSSLVDRYGQVGVRAGLRVVSGSIEAGYSLTLLPLGRTMQVCRGDQPVATLTDGAIDDAAVEYTCVRRRDAPQVDLLDAVSAIQVHQLDGGMRFYASGDRLFRRSRLDDDGETAPRPDRVRFFAVLFGGPRLATAAETNPSRKFRFGFGLGAGAGIEGRLASRIALVGDLRYQADLLTTSGTPSRNADRAVAAGRGVVGTVVDSFHSFAISLAVRVDLR